MAKDVNDKMALILSGGGARGAYEAGVMHYIRSALPKRFAEQNFPIQCGSSVGAINISYLASTAHKPELQGKNLYRLWSEIKQEDVYYRNFKALKSFMGNALLGLGRNFTKWNPLARKSTEAHHFRSVFNTAPFGNYLNQAIKWPNIAKNVKSGRLKVVSLVATRMRTGKTELFVQKNPALEYIGPYQTLEVDINPLHALSSAAIPFLFPSVNVQGRYYVDGGVRLNTPLSPAVQFGANKLFVVSLHSNKISHQEEMAGIDQSADDASPSVGEYFGKMLNGIFLDRLEYDIEQMHRINQIIDRSIEVFGADYLPKINKGAKKTLRNGQVVRRHFRKIGFFEIGPSVPISDVFMDWFNNHRKGRPHFSTLENLLLRAFDINTESSLDLLSYLTFAHDYIKMLLDLGYKDAHEKRDEIMAFMEEKVD